MSNDKVIRFTDELAKEEKKKGALFIREQWLDQLPEDWIDCIMFIATQGLKKEMDFAPCIFIDDALSAEINTAISKDYIKLFIFRTEENVVWNAVLSPEKVEGKKDLQKLIIGGENLRKFCDKKNIYYRTAKAASGELLSGTNMQWQKKPGEDCRSPVNEH